MREIGHRSSLDRSLLDRSLLVGLDVGRHERMRASAAVMRRASAQGRLDGAQADATSLGQHVARWGLTVVAIVLASALYALQVHATLH